MPEDAIAFEALLGIVRGYQGSRAVAAAAELGIADLLQDGPVPVDVLAERTGTDAATLYRLLRALAAIGVFHEDDQHRFAQSPMSEYLRRDHPLSVDPVTRMFVADYEWRAWAALTDSVRTGANAAELALGTDVWEHRRRHPADGEIFDASMRTLTRASTEDILAAHDFGRYAVIADVGGGTGALLAAVLRAHPGAHGILCDQPQVVARAGAVLGGLADRVRVVGGDFFEAAPAGADCYLLRRILHDWEDEPARQILRRLREVATPSARVLVLDAVVGPPNADPAAKFLDLMMLVSAGGRERTDPEWTALLDSAGFRVESSVRVTSNMHLIEAAPQ